MSMGVGWEGTRGVDLRSAGAVGAGYDEDSAGDHIEGWGGSDMVDEVSKNEIDQASIGLKCSSNVVNT